MRTIEGWFLSVMALLGLVLALHQMGVDPTASVAPTLRNVVHVLNQPLV
jgi:hypothetical protein